MIKIPSSLAALAGVALLAISASSQAAEYAIEPIISPEGGYVYPTSIAANGMVVGTVSSYDIHCFKYMDGVFTKLPLPPQTVDCTRAVTDLQGNITMTVHPADNPAIQRVVELTVKGNFLPIAGLSPDMNVVMASKGGRMAGHSQAPTGEPQAYLFSRKGPGVNVGALTGMSHSWLTGLNAKGWAVGYAAQPAQSDRTYAFRYKDGRLQWLDPLAEGSSAKAFDINADGVVTGFSELTPGSSMSMRAVAWTRKPKPRDLGTLNGWFTQGQAINAEGIVVGRFSPGSAGMRYRKGVMSDLTGLISPEDKTHWLGSLGEATSINDNGLIAGGFSRYDGIFGVGYLLRPLP